MQALWPDNSRDLTASARRSQARRSTCPRAGRCAATACRACDTGRGKSPGSCRAGISWAGVSLDSAFCESRPPCATAPSVIKKFMSEPDATTSNRVYASAAEVKLYAMNRIETIESSPEFVAANEKADARRLACRRAADTRRQKRKEWSDNLEVEVPVIPQTDVEVWHVNTTTGTGRAVDSMTRSRGNRMSESSWIASLSTIFATSALSTNGFWSRLSAGRALMTREQKSRRKCWTLLPTRILILPKSA